VLKKKVDLGKNFEAFGKDGTRRRNFSGKKRVPPVDPERFRPKEPGKNSFA